MSNPITRLLDVAGVTATLRRPPATDATVKIAIGGIGSQEVLGTISQVDREIWMSADTLSGWSLPPVDGDQIILNSNTAVISEAIPFYWRGDLVAYCLKVLGRV